MSSKTFARAFAAGALLLIGLILLAVPSPQVFRVRDDCDPATFNASGRVICNPAFPGGTTVERFLQELTADQKVGSWRFNPDKVELDQGQGTSLESRAGEFHTFTRVDEFGGGISARLNTLSGSGPTRPECGSLGALASPSSTNIFVPDAVSAPSQITGPVAGSSALPVGTTKWMCCLHPWMRSEVTVKQPQ